MSEEKPTGLTTGFKMISETRREQDKHENVYHDKNLFIPSIALAGVCLLGMILAIASGF